MNPEALLESLYRQQIKVEVRNGQLKVNAPKGQLTEELRRNLERCKAAIVEHLSNGFADADQDGDNPATRVPLPQPNDRLIPQTFQQPRETSRYSAEDVQSGVNAIRLLMKLDERYRARTPSEE